MNQQMAAVAVQLAASILSLPLVAILELAIISWR